MWELLSSIAKCAAQTGSEVYLVGGALRDLMMGLEPGDLDFAVSDHVFQLARQVAGERQGRLVTLDKERETLRVALPNQRHLDFSLFKGQTIEEDLRARDFTLNALALPLVPGIHKEAMGHLLDPTGGCRDIRLGLLRATGRSSIMEDPLRALRGVRFAAQFQLTIMPETAVLMKQGCRKLSQVAGERTWQELTGFLGLPAVYPWVDYADRELKLWHVLLPGRLRMEQTKQNFYHVENVWRHSLRTFHCLEVILKELPFALEEGRQALDSLQRKLAGGRSRLPLLKLAALIHDVGKPDTAVTQPTGRISFHGHSQAGVPYAEAMADQLKMSRAERQYLASLVLLHMQPLHLYTSGNYSDLFLYRLFRTLGDHTPDVLVLSLADLTATYTAGERLSELTPYQHFIFSLIKRYFSESDKFRPVPYLSGSDLLELGVVEGPRVGELLEQLLEAQVTGEVRDVDAARRWVKGKLPTL
ncbi:CCA tRNA nucleotidyltransferase [Desulforamulus putei]|uniref:Poly(A) polymerase n=1 Tax=Desulforamulus putei DSM 12395 TaxID=1121429 RepID=A0A1M5C5G5_9FIRM|nr:HD domain-containing protein [Desulforamulus putei]SHF49941.1 poly(A) polymerase [Desulforamulus putei DSM 12395]